MRRAGAVADTKQMMNFPGQMPGICLTRLLKENARAKFR
jgi:hypothetical protein